MNTDIHPKVAAGSSAATIGGATSVLVIYLLSQHGITLTQPVSDAITVLVTAFAGLVAGYITPSPKGS